MSEEFDYGDDELEVGSLNKDSGLARLSELVRQMAQDAMEIDRIKADLKSKEQEYENLTRIIIPDLMEELGQDACKTSNGVQISIKRVVKASITNKNRQKAVEWLENNNCGRMLKDEFVVKLTKNEKINKGTEDEKLAAPAVQEALESLGLDFDNKRTCHHATLSAFVRERDAAGEETPADVLNIFRYKEAKIG